MLIYVPEHASFLCDAYGVNILQPGTQGPRGIIDTQAPPLPHITSIPLPLESTTPLGTSSEHSQDARADMYPLNITSHLTFGQQLRLRGIGLTTPIHVHSPVAHIGTITTVPPNQVTTALDVVFLLRSIVNAPLDSNPHLSLDMKDRVRRVFLRCSGSTEPRVRDRAWPRFVSGDMESHGPLGVDLLLGNNEIWGLEACSVGGYSVVHVANVGSV